MPPLRSLLLLVAVLGVGAKECSLTCESDCVKCSGSRVVNNTRFFDIDVSSCKGGDTLSWACCPGCSSIDVCDGQTTGLKCDELVHATYAIDAAATQTIIQVHYGALAGNVDCDTQPCCGGSGGSCETISGVCNFEIDLSTCENNNPEPECLVHSDCPSNGCGDGICEGGTCGLQPKPLGTVCREAVVGTDGATCDISESCDGINTVCPEDKFLERSVVCRGLVDYCDVVEVCTGNTSTCPIDERNDYGKTFKCANTCFLCGISPFEVNVNKGGVSVVGSTKIGKCEEYVELDWPSCENICVSSPCDNNRGLSNIAHFQCVKDNGQWMLLNKLDISSSTSLPVCPPWTL